MRSARSREAGQGHWGGEGQWTSFALEEARGRSAQPAAFGAWEIGQNAYALAAATGRRRMGQTFSGHRPQCAPAHGNDTATRRGARLGHGQLRLGLEPAMTQSPLRSGRAGRTQARRLPAGARGGDDSFDPRDNADNWEEVGPGKAGVVTFGASGAGVGGAATFMGDGPGAGGGWDDGFEQDDAPVSWN